MSKALLGADPSAQPFAATLRPVTEPKAAKISPRERFKEAAREEGYAAGYGEGLSVGLAEGNERARLAAAAEIARVASELDSIGETVREALDLWYRQSEESLALLSVAIAERIVARELELSEEAILSITREALREVTHASTARIRVNPFHSGVLETYREQLLAVAPSLKNIEIVSDSSMLSGCVVETEGGAVDASIRAKLRNLLGEAA
ncbi:MAG: FliH/SctL family protein [Fimbriimonadaceae bacterium]